MRSLASFLVIFTAIIKPIIVEGSLKTKGLGRNLKCLISNFYTMRKYPNV